MQAARASRRKHDSRLEPSRCSGPFCSALVLTCREPKGLPQSCISIPLSSLFKPDALLCASLLPILIRSGLLAHLLANGHKTTPRHGSNLSLMHDCGQFADSPALTSSFKRFYFMQVYGHIHLILDFSSSTSVWLPLSAPCMHSPWVSKTHRKQQYHTDNEQVHHTQHLAYSGKPGGLEC